MSSKKVLENKVRRYARKRGLELVKSQTLVNRQYLLVRKVDKQIVSGLVMLTLEEALALLGAHPVLQTKGLSRPLGLDEPELLPEGVTRYRTREEAKEALRAAVQRGLKASRRDRVVTVQQDARALLESLMEKGRLEGTGYNPDDLDEILAEMDALPETDVLPETV